MKALFTLAALFSLTFIAKSQAVLNEIYAFPGSSNHEFFELYNTSTSQTPISVDGYTLISYFDEGKNSGFYVIDLPNLSMNSKGYIVGSASIPFNYQGNVGSNNSDFSWNDADFRNGATFGYIKKWVKSNANTTDGNLYYDEEPVATNFNDFFSRMKGNGASYNAFLYKDGVLVNSFLGSTGGTSAIPSDITSMPPLNFESVTALGNSSYLIDFSTYSNLTAETVTQEIGTDNGFIRMNDGMCGTWNKSSSQAFHTPKAANSNVSQMVPSGSLTIEAHITRGANPGDSSFIVYNITAGPGIMLPVELLVYADNGSVMNEWDANDVFLESNTEHTISDGPFLKYFMPQDQQLIIVARTASGCYDQVRLILNPFIDHITLPAKLKMSTVKAIEEKSFLEWVVMSNESASYFEIEKSSNKENFTTVATVKATAKPGDVYYTYSESYQGSQYYRIKVVNKNGTSFYSPVLFVKESMVQENKLWINEKLGSNPALSYYAKHDGQCTITVYNMNGIRMLQKQKHVQQGQNVILLEGTERWISGIYIIEIVQHGQRITTKFNKR